ncbi:MAG: ABC transporter substrate-binding protein [Firmicutes bacterium]|nr:ABC transporter substrate-binding protein [Bacillota bacterium]
MLNRRFVVIGAVMLLLVFALGSISAAAEQVTLRFLSHNYKPWNDLLRKQATEFEKLHPNVKIEYTTVNHEDLYTKLMTSLVAGTAPDIIGVHGPWMAELVKSGWLDPAPTPVVEDIRQNTVAVAGQSAEYNGKIYGYIQHIGIPTPIVNVDLYEQAGLELPTTYEELLAANKKLDKYDANGRLVQAGTTLMATKEGYWNVIHWSTIVRAFGSQYISKDGTKAAFNTPPGLEATKVYAKLTHANFMNAPDAFTLGKSAMMWGGPWDRAFFRQNNPRLKFKAIPPLKGPARQVTSMYAWFWVVNAASSPAQKEWAWKFLQYLSNDEKYLEMANKIGFISFRKANYSNEEYVSDPWIRAFGKALEVAEVYYAKIPGWAKVDTAMAEELERMVVGEQSPEKALAKAEKRINAILAELR